MAKFYLTRNSAIKIVELGTETRIDLRQKIKTLPKKYKQKRSRYGHWIGTLISSISSPTEYEIVSVTMPNNTTKQIECSAPLLRAGDTLEAGTVCVIQQDRTGNWHITAAQCPEED